MKLLVLNLLIIILKLNNIFNRFYVKWYTKQRANPVKPGPTMNTQRLLIRLELGLFSCNVRRGNNWSLKHKIFASQVPSKYMFPKKFTSSLKFLKYSSSQGFPYGKFGGEGGTTPHPHRRVLGGVGVGGFRQEIWWWGNVFFFPFPPYIVRIRNLSILIVLLIPIVSKGQGQGPPTIMNQKEINSSASPPVLHARKKTCRCDGMCKIRQIKPVCSHKADKFRQGNK